MFLIVVPLNPMAIATNCPFKNGVYHLKISTTAEPNVCQDIASSKVTVNGIKMAIDSCINVPLEYGK